MKLEFLIDEDITIKEYIYNNISRNFYGYLKEHNVIYTVDGIIKKAHEKVIKNSQLIIEYEETKKQEGIYNEKELNIVFEDEYYLVLDKPAHLQTIPSRKNPYDSVFNRLLYYFKDTNYTVHILNRLDKETKGLILVAKSNYAAAIMKEYNKVYIAKTLNKLPKLSDRIILPIKRVDGSIKREVNTDGDIAITNYHLIDSNDLYTYEVLLETGRTHQIRVHFSYLNSPLINDTLYNGASYGDETLGLVCKEISFIHPLKKIKLQFESLY